LSICERFRDSDGKSVRRVLQNLGEESLEQIAKQILTMANTKVNSEITIKKYMPGIF
jgi:Ca2+-binding EF-hand superfamily protein